MRQVRMACFLGLANLAANAVNHRTILQENCLEFLIQGAELYEELPPGTLSHALSAAHEPQKGAHDAAAANEASEDELPLR